MRVCVCVAGSGSAAGRRVGVAFTCQPTATSTSNQQPATDNFFLPFPLQREFSQCIFRKVSGTLGSKFIEP